MEEAETFPELVTKAAQEFDLRFGWLSKLGSLFGSLL